MKKRNEGNLDEAQEKEERRTDSATSGGEDLSVNKIHAQSKEMLFAALYQLCFRHDLKPTSAIQVRLLAVRPAVKKSTFSDQRRPDFCRRVQAKASDQAVGGVAGYHTFKSMSHVHDFLTRRVHTQCPCLASRP